MAGINRAFANLELTGAAARWLGRSKNFHRVRRRMSCYAGDYFMAVFVDDMKAAYRGMKMCHMMADTTPELLAMADLIGVASHHIQHGGTFKEHFDICQSKRALAIGYGAKPITLRQSGVLIVLKMARSAVLHGGTIAVPKQLLVCPECCGRLDFEVNEWETETGLPVFGGFYLNCENESSVNHRHWQSDWQPVIDRAGELFMAVDA